MEKISYNLVFNRTKRLNKKGMALVQVEAYLNSRKRYFSTKIYLKPNQWDAKRSMVKNHPNSNILNQMLYKHIATIEQAEFGLWRRGKAISLDLLKESIDKPVGSDKSFLAFFKEEVANSSLKENTKQNHLSTLELLQKFKREVLFTDLTFDFVSSFDNYLQSKEYHLNTIAKHMKHLKRYINAAINKDYMDAQKYAFRKYKIKSVEGSHTNPLFRVGAPYYYAGLSASTAGSFQFFLDDTNYDFAGMLNKPGEYEATKINTGMTENKLPLFINVTQTKKVGTVYTFTYDVFYVKDGQNVNYKEGVTADLDFDIEGLMAE